jgi:catechol 2,3-dioxygenase-like lactoylglutathione lyase family enzyme
VVGVERIVPIIKVSDLHTALNFYCSVLGFDKDFHYRASPDGPDYVGVSLNGHQLHLSTFSGDGKGLATIYIYVDDIDELYARFCARGLAKDCEPTNQPWGQREVYVRDPDGHTLRFGSRVPAASC